MSGEEIERSIKADQEAIKWLREWAHIDCMESSVHQTTLVLVLKNLDKRLQELEAWRKEAIW